MRNHVSSLLLSTDDLAMAEGKLLSLLLPTDDLAMPEGTVYNLLLHHSLSDLISIHPANSHTGLFGLVSWFCSWCSICLAHCSLTPPWPTPFPYQVLVQMYLPSEAFPDIPVSPPFFTLFSPQQLPTLRHCTLCLVSCSWTLFVPQMWSH